jgi:hypothetical protein
MSTGLGLLALTGGLLTAAVDGVKVTTDRTVDASSLETIVADVIRLAGAKTDDQKGIALYNYLNQVMFHHAYACEKKPRSVGPLKVINVYGWGLCGGEHTVMKALFETAGWPVRYRGWSDPGHTTVEAQYGGRWHYYDVFLKGYWWTKDRSTIAGQDDIVADPSIVLDGANDKRVPVESYLCCGDEAAGVVQGCRNSKAEPVSKHADGWASVTGRDQGYSPLLTLRSGATLRLEWAGQSGMMVADNTSGRHTCPNLKDLRANPLIGPVLEHYGDRSWSNGRVTYAPDFAKPQDLADITLANASATGGRLVAKGPGSAVFKLDLPYPYAAATLVAAGEGELALSISTDRGMSWTAAPAGDVGALVRQAYDVWVKADFTGTLERLSLDGVIEHNRAAQPFLRLGRNQVTVSTADDKLPPGTVLVVTYEYQECTATGKRTQWNGKGLTYGETRTVTRELTKLPATFDITVAGSTEPRMVSFSRTLRAK